jgi:hypothetical protein
MHSFLIPFLEPARVAASGLVTISNRISCDDGCDLVGSRDGADPPQEVGSIASFGIDFIPASENRAE